MKKAKGKSTKSQKTSKSKNISKSPQSKDKISMKEKYTNMMVDVMTGKRNLNDIKEDEFIRKKRKHSNRSGKNKKEERDDLSETDYNPLYAINNLNKLSDYISSDSEPEIEEANSGNKNNNIKLRKNNSRKKSKKIQKKKIKSGENKKPKVEKNKSPEKFEPIFLQNCDKNDKLKNTKNIESINYYNKRIKMNNKYNFVDKNIFYEIDSDKIIYQDDNELVYLNIKSGKKKKFKSQDLRKIKDNYFVSTENFDRNKITILEIKNDDIKVIQEIPFPKEIEFENLLITVFNEETLLFYTKSEDTSIYVYKKNKTNNNSLIYKLYQKISLEEEAHIYADTRITRIFKLNQKEFFVYVICDQRPPTNSFIIQMLNSNVQHKEATYFAIYHLDEKNGKFKLKNSKVNLENLVDIEDDSLILNQKYFLYYANVGYDLQEYHILDIYNMKIIFTFHEVDNRTKLVDNFDNSNENNSKNFIIKNEDGCRQYEINDKENEIKLIGVNSQFFYQIRKFKNGILISVAEGIYFLKHE
jgi:hypothetical protein